MSVEKILEAHTEQDAENFRKIDAKLDALLADVTSLKLQAAKDRGWLAGASFVAGGIMALVFSFGKELLQWLRG